MLGFPTFGPFSRFAKSRFNHRVWIIPLQQLTLAPFQVQSIEQREPRGCVRELFHGPGDYLGPLPAHNAPGH